MKQVRPCVHLFRSLSIGKTSLLWQYLLPSFLGLLTLATGVEAAENSATPRILTEPSITTELAQGTGAATRVEEIAIRDEGIVIKTSGKMPEFAVNRSQDGSWMSIDVLGASLSSSRTTERVNQAGVSLMQVTQLSTQPPVVRVTVSTPQRNQGWESRAFSQGVIVWPVGSPPPAIANTATTARIQSVELRNNTDLVVTADQPLLYTTGWDQQSGAYSLTFFSAELPEDLKLPQRQVGGPLIWTRRRQEDDNTVSLLLKPATGVQIGDTYQSNNSEQLTLRMGFGMAGVTPPRPGTPPPTLSPIIPRPGDSPPPLSWPLPPVQNNPAPTNPRTPNERILVVIDPGHGGPVDRGAISASGLEEKDVVLEISLQVTQILEQNGVQVVMTRRDDRDLDLPPRADLANRVNANIFVSIHANAISLSRPDVNGIETFYYQSGQPLAQYIQNSMLQAFPTMNNRGVKQARFYVLRNTRMPSALVEVGFLTGNYDSRILADPAQRTRFAQAIAQGILNYIRAGGR